MTKLRTVQCGLWRLAAGWIWYNRHAFTPNASS